MRPNTQKRKRKMRYQRQYTKETPLARPLALQPRPHDPTVVEQDGSLASVGPDSTLQVLPNRGHMLHHAQLSEVIAAVDGSARPALASPRLRSRSCLAAWSRRRHVTGNATLPSLDALATFEARDAAGNDRSRRSESEKLLANVLQRHTRFLGDLEVQPLSISAQAFEHFEHRQPL